MRLARARTVKNGTDERRERNNGVAFAKNNSYISRVHETGLRRAEKQAKKREESGTLTVPRARAPLLILYSLEDADAATSSYYFAFALSSLGICVLIKKERFLRVAFYSGDTFPSLKGVSCRRFIWYI